MSELEGFPMDVRIDALKGVVAGLDREDVQRISLPLPDDARRAALARAVAAAEAAGRRSRAGGPADEDAP